MERKIPVLFEFDSMDDVRVKKFYLNLLLKGKRISIESVVNAFTRINVQYMEI